MFFPQGFYVGKIRGKIRFLIRIFKKTVKLACFILKCAKCGRKTVFSRKIAKHVKNTVFTSVSQITKEKKSRVGAIFQGQSGYRKQTYVWWRPNANMLECLVTRVGHAWAVVFLFFLKNRTLCPRHRNTTGRNEQTSWSNEYFNNILS